MGMAQQATPVRFKVQLSDVDRGVYESFELKMAQHPSETRRYLLARLFAWCVVFEEGLAFSKGGLSSPDEPALSSHTLDGRLTLWVEVGTPSPDRLHKASKASPRVVVFTQHDPRLLVESLAGHKVHKLEEIKAYALAPAFLDEVDQHLGERGGDVAVTITEGSLYVDVGGVTINSQLTPVVLTAS